MSRRGGVAEVAGGAIGAVSVDIVCGVLTGEEFGFGTLENTANGATWFSYS
jgi:hypothetical protein